MTETAWWLFPARTTDDYLVSVSSLPNELIYWQQSLQSRRWPRHFDQSRRVDSRLLSARFRLVAIWELMRNERQRLSLNLPLPASAIHAPTATGYGANCIDRSEGPEVHVHRIGRTGRASQKGLAPSLATMDDMGLVGNTQQMQSPRRSWPAATSGSSTLSALH